MLEMMLRQFRLYMLKKWLLGTCCVYSTVCLVITAARRICFSINYDGK